MDNVVQFRGKPAIFSTELRQKLETGNVPPETVTTVEQIICTHLIAIARRLAVAVGQHIGGKISRKLAANE